VSIEQPPIAELTPHPGPRLGPHKQPWERQPREPSRSYAAFCYVRNQGPERTIRQGVKAYLTGDCPANAPQRARQQRRYRTHDRPAAYLESVRGQWRRWSSRFHWFERCGAYDDNLSAVANEQAFEASLAFRKAEIEENLRQRQLRIDESRMARGVIRGVLLQTVKLISNEALDDAKMDEILPLLPRMITALDVAQKSERLELALGKADEPASLSQAEEDEQVKTLAREVIVRVERDEQERLDAARDVDDGDGDDDNGAV